MAPAVWRWRLLRLLGAAAGGALTYMSYEPHGWWLGGILGSALLIAALAPWPSHRPRLRDGALMGFSYALITYILLLPWVGELVGVFPYLALAVSMASWSVLLGIGAVAILRWRWGFAAVVPFYLLIEYGRSSVPFGGFPWLRLAWGQINGPLAHLAPIGGTAVVGAATVWVGACLSAAILYRQLRWTSLGLAAGVMVAAVAAGWSAQPPAEPQPTVTVAAIQGNVPRLGLEFNAQRRAVLANHARVTHELAAERDDIDLVFWPENSSDVNPFRDREAGALIAAAVDDIGAPTLVGTITYDEVGARNTMQVFLPGRTVGQYHHKKYLQPFGETMPYREFFRKFSDYVDLAGDFKPGNGNGVVSMAGITVGVATCYEVAFDEAFRTAVRSGAQVLTTPTNNATFGFSDMTYQQLAMSRFRALETDRAVVVPATSGVSAIVDPRGQVLSQTGIFEPGYLVAELPLRETVTLSVRYGRGIERVLIVLGAVLVALALLPLGRNRPSSKNPR